MKEKEQEPDVFPFDDALIALIADIDTGHRALAQQEQGALALFARQHDLKGEWRVAENRREFVRTPQPQVVNADHELQ